MGRGDLRKMRTVGALLGGVMALAITAVANSTVGLADSSTQVLVDRQAYVADVAVDPYAREGQPSNPYCGYEPCGPSLHVGVSGGSETHRSFVHLDLSGAPSGLVAVQGSLTLRSGQITKNDQVQPGQSQVEACVLKGELPAKFDPSKPPDFDRNGCTKGSVEVTGSPSTQDLEVKYVFDLASLLSRWRGSGNTGAALVPTTIGPSDFWQVGFDQGLSTATVTYASPEPSGGVEATPGSVSVPPTPAQTPVQAPIPVPVPVPVPAVPTANPLPRESTPPSPSPSPSPEAGGPVAAVVGGAGGGGGAGRSAGGFPLWVVVAVGFAGSILGVFSGPWLLALGGGARPAVAAAGSRTHHWLLDLPPRQRLSLIGGAGALIVIGTLSSVPFGPGQSSASAPASSSAATSSSPATSNTSQSQPTQGPAALGPGGVTTSPGSPGTVPTTSTLHPVPGQQQNPAAGGFTAPGVSGGVITIGDETSTTPTGVVTALGGSIPGAFSATDPLPDVVSYINAHGGMGGYQVRLVVHQADYTGSQWSVESQASCDAFTRDIQVFAAISNSYGNGDVLDNCMAERHTPLFSHELWQSDHEDWVQNIHYLYGIEHLDATLMNREYVDALWAKGFFQSGSKVALLRYDGTTWDGIDNEAIRPALASHGLSLTDDIHFTPINSEGQDLGQEAQECQSAEVKLRADQVDHVLFLDDGGALDFLCGRSWDGAGYHPRFGMNSTQQPYYMATNVPAASLKDAMGVGWLPGWDVTSNDGIDQQNPTYKVCRDIFNRNNFPAATPMTQCDDLFLMKAALDLTRLPTPAGLEAGINALKGSYTPVSLMGADFSPSRHYAASGYRIFEWNGRVFKYTTPTLALP